MYSKSNAQTVFVFVPHQSSPAVVDTVTRGDFGHPELEPQTGTFRQDSAVESASGEV